MIKSSENKLWIIFKKSSELPYFAHICAWLVKGFDFI